MAYVYGKTKSRAPLAAAPAVVEPVVEPEVVEEPAPVPEAAPKPANRGRTPGRKRGPGKNNKHGSGCGSNSGYWAHKRAGEDTCAKCIRAHLDYNRAFDQAAKARRAA